MTYLDIIDRSSIDRHHAALNDTWALRCDSSDREVPVSGHPSAPPPEPVMPLNPSGRPAGNICITAKRVRGSGLMGPCSDPLLAHDTKFNGIDRSTGKLRIKCIRCGQTRGATEEEINIWRQRRERLSSASPAVKSRPGVDRSKEDCGHRDWRPRGKDPYGRKLVKCRVCGVKRLREAVSIQ